MKQFIKWALFAIVLFFIVMWSGCGSVTKNKTRTITDSTIYREYDVPIKIKETTINHSVKLDSLCEVYQALIKELKSRKQKETTIIYRDSERGDLTAKIDSLGRLIMQAKTNAIDSTLKGKETINVKKKEVKRSVEKKRSPWFIWMIVGILLGVFTPFLFRVLMKAIKPI